jgi:tripartite-type tricarboxylate transporter receptor subunit TctC
MVNSLLTGTTPVAIVGLPNFIPYIRNGQVIPIAVDTDSGSPLFPDVPTLQELGFPKLPSVYFSFVAPSGVPNEIIRKLHDEIAAVGNDPDFLRRQLTDIGLVPVFDTPEHLAAFLKEQRAIDSKLIQESGRAAIVRRYGAASRHCRAPPGICRAASWPPQLGRRLFRWPRIPDLMGGAIRPP